MCCRWARGFFVTVEEKDSRMDLGAQIASSSIGVLLQYQQFYLEYGFIYMVLSGKI